MSEVDAHLLNLHYLADGVSQLDKKWQDVLLTNCYDRLLVIDNTLNNLSAHETIYPPRDLIFNALKLTPFDNVNVVILGQDPYHGEGEANGLAFSVNSGIKLPPSLKNIYKELNLEYGKAIDADGALLNNWAMQGVLLLNTALTVIKDRANSLSDIGWHEVTDKLIHYISSNKFGVVFILWGGYAKSKLRLIDESKHKVLLAPHPSPLSVHRGFYGCNHFRLANEYLISLGKEPVNWINAKNLYELG